MIYAMRCNPEDRSAFERHRSTSCEEVLKPLRHLVAAMCEQTVVGHADADVDCKKVHYSRNGEVLPREEEQCSDGADVERAHEDTCDPVDPPLLIGAAHPEILLQAA